MSPNTKRRVYQRWVQHALNDGDRFLNNLNQLRGIFEPHHPEYVKLLECIAMMIIQAQESLYEFHLHAWGKPPQGWSKE